MHFLFFMLMFVGHGLSFSFYCLCNTFFILRWKNGKKLGEKEKRRMTILEELGKRGG